MNSFTILAVDDEQDMLDNYRRILSRAGYRVETALSAEAALKLLQDDSTFSLIICDLKMPGMDGMELLTNLKQTYPHIPVIMITGYGTLEIGIEAVKNGAFDFIEKPFSGKKLLSAVEKALEQIVPEIDQQNKKLGFDNIVGKSPVMRAVFDLIKKVAFGNANVLITGESGVGKELVARSIHKNSLRRNHPLIPINCGALPDQLFESELFGYEKGAFTGAFQSKPGLVELANGGTLFLDEVSEMPQNLQVKMLRMLEERKIRRIGGQKEIPVNIRIISATNRNIDQSLEQNLLREDFFYRINTIQIHIPALRERAEDIPLLVEHFLSELEGKYNRGIRKIEPEALKIVRTYSWPGNVRELQNVIERTYYLASPPVIRNSDLPSYLTAGNSQAPACPWQELPYREAKECVLEDFEKRYLSTQLQKYDWNISRTAEACEMDRRTIHRLIKKYDIRANQNNRQ